MPCLLLLQLQSLLEGAVDASTEAALLLLRCDQIAEASRYVKGGGSRLPASLRASAAA